MTRGKRALINQAARDLPRSDGTATMRARHRSTCPDCGKAILPGQGLSLIKRNGKKEWRHATCALPCGPGRTAAPSRR